MSLIGKSSTDRNRMNLLSSKLNRRCIIQKIVKESQEMEDDDFTSFEAFNSGSETLPILETYKYLKTIWCSNLAKQSFTDFISAVRGQQDYDRVTHELWFRWESVKQLGTAFSSGFSNGFDSMGDINNLKNDYCIFIKHNNVGRRFRIVETRLDEVNHEFVRARCRELEEVGTGYAND